MFLMSLKSTEWLEKNLSNVKIIDIDNEGGLDIDKLDPSIHGIIVTNIFGNLVNIEKYETYCKKHNLFFKIRTSEDYKFSNLYLIVDLKYPNGKLQKDTLEYQMARPDGSMLGDGLMFIKEHKLWYKGHKNPFVFSEIGDYTISIRQAMRALNNVSGLKSLEGVLDVGFSIENLD